MADASLQTAVSAGWPRCDCTSPTDIPVNAYGMRSHATAYNVPITVS